MAREPASGRTTRYTRSRVSILIAGVAALLVLGGISYLRGVDRVEVAANLLFIPVFVAAVYRGVWGGGVIGVMAAAAYAALRYRSIQAVGWDVLGGQVLFRASAFPLFGLIGGWAASQLGSSISKLELYDHVDDATGLFNARHFLHDADLETSRAQRYRSIFSVVEVAIPADLFSALARKPRARALSHLGTAVREHVRTVDRASHAQGEGFHRIAVVLPETAEEGATIFGTRFQEFVAGILQREGCDVSGAPIELTIVTMPGDDDALNEMRVLYRRLDEAEHPSTDDPSSAGSA